MTPTERALRRLEQATQSYHRLATELVRMGAPAGTEDALERARLRVVEAEHVLRAALARETRHVA